MPRLARLDAPGVLHHIMIRGIEHRKIFRNNKYILLMADRAHLKNMDLRMSTNESGIRQLFIFSNVQALVSSRAITSSSVNG